MWHDPQALNTVANIAHACWEWLPTITTTLRFTTAVIAFLVGTHRGIRYIRDARRSR